MPTTATLTTSHRQQFSAEYPVTDGEIFLHTVDQDFISGTSFSSQHHQVRYQSEEIVVSLRALQEEYRAVQAFVFKVQ